ncbi:hypothetical protein Lepto7375DRAFT_7278 [Leptolyngbya sp. PCC 7375]|nr:hypothetical protein Lepto7375DRAFT_7278 [Leptolyngbya sp. PCC 7375]
MNCAIASSQVKNLIGEMIMKTTINEWLDSLTLTSVEEGYELRVETTYQDVVVKLVGMEDEHLTALQELVDQGQQCIGELVHELIYDEPSQQFKLSLKNGFQIYTVSI